MRAHPPPLHPHPAHEGNSRTCSRTPALSLPTGQIFFLAAPAGHGADAAVYVWLGTDAGDEEEATRLGDEFRDEASCWGFTTSRLGARLPVHVVKSGEEPDIFWTYFVNG